MLAAASRREYNYVERMDEVNSRNDLHNLDITILHFAAIAKTTKGRRNTEFNPIHITDATKRSRRVESRCIGGVN